MTFTPKSWQNAPSTATPTDAAAFIDIETRLSNYTDLTSSQKSAYSFLVSPNAGGGGYTATSGIPGNTTTFTNVDAAAVVMSCITSLGSTGGTILLAPGSFAWNSVPALTRNTPWRILGSGIGSTVIVPDGVAGRRVFDCNRIADYDLFRDIEIGGFMVDCTAFATMDKTNHKAQQHIIFGNQIDNVWQQRLNLARIYIHDCRCTNVPTNFVADTSATPYWNGVGIGTFQPGLGETQNTITDVVVERVRIEGGNVGIFVGGASVGGALASNGGTVFCDNITIRDCWHDTGAPMTVVNSCANFFVGWGAQVGRVLIENCVGKNASDSGIELDSCASAVIRNCKIIDCNNNSFLGVNFNVPPGGPEAQVWLFEDCVAEKRVAGGGPSGFRLSTQNSNPHGKWIMKNCSWTKVCDGINCTPNSLDGPVTLGGSPDIREIVIDGFHMDFQNYAIGAGGVAVVGIALGNIKSTLGRPTHIALRDIDLVLNGSNAGASTVCGIRVDCSAGNSVFLDVDGYTIDENITSIGSGGLRGFELGRFNGQSTMNWDIRNVKLMRATNSPSSPQLFKIGSTTALVINRGVIHDFDMSRAGSNASEVVYDAPSNAANVQILGGRWRTGGNWQRDGQPTDANYTIQKDGTLFTARSGIQGVADIKGTSTTDVAAVVQACITALGAAGGTIKILPGTYPWGSIPKLTRNMTGGLRILGSGPDETILTMSDGGRRIFDFDQVADHDTFRNIELGQFGIDASPLSGLASTHRKNHLIIGNYYDGTTNRGAAGDRYNVDRLYIHDIHATSIPSDTTLTHHHQGIWIIPYHTANSEATQNFITNVTLERIRLEGGNQGFVVGGGNTVGTVNSTDTNIVMDNLVCRDCYHNTGIVPGTTTWTSSNILFGYMARSGHMTIENFWGEGCGDGGMEIDCPTLAVVKNSTIKNCSNGAYYMVNMNNPVDGRSNCWSFQDCRVIVDDTASVNTKGWFGFVNGAPASEQPGQLIIRNCTDTRSTATLADSTVGGHSVSCGGFTNIDIDGLDIKYTGFTNVATNQTHRLVSTSTGTSGGHLTPEYSFKRIRMYMAGTVTSGSPVFEGILGFYTPSSLKMEDCTWEDAITSAPNNSVRPFLVGWTSGSFTLPSVLVRRCRTIASSDAFHRCITVHGTGTTTLTNCRIEDCDFSALGANGQPILYQGTSNAANVEVTGCQWKQGVGWQRDGQITGPSYVIYADSTNYFAQGGAGVPDIQGGTDPAALVQSCITALGVAGGSIRLTAGAYTWASIPSFLANMTGAIQVEFDPNAKITLAGGVRLFDVTKGADYDIIQNIRLIGYGCTIDCASLNGKHHTLIGNYKAGVATTRLSWKNIYVDGFNIINAVTDQAGTQNRNAIWMTSATSAPAETVKTMTNIVVRNVRMTGGNTCILVSGQGADAGGSVYVDDILIENIWWDSTASPTGFTSSAGIQTGSLARGGKVRVRNCYVRGAYDVGYEVADSFTDATIENCVAEDCYTEGFLINNFSPPTLSDLTTLTEQVVIYRNCRYRQLSANTGRNPIGFAITGSNDFGTIIHEDCTVELNNISTSATNLSGLGFYAQTITKAKKLAFNNFTFRMKDYVHNYTGGVVGHYGIRVACTSLTELDINGYRCELNGAHGASSTQFQFRGVATSGAVRFNIDRMTYSLAETGTINDNAYAVNIGIATSTSQGIIKRLRVEANSGPTTPRVIGINDSTLLTIPDRITIEECDFTDCSASTVEITHIGAADQKAKVYTRANKWKTIPASGSWPSLAATTVANTNLFGYPVLVIVNGGTSTASNCITTATPGGSTQTVLNQGAVAFPYTNFVVPAGGQFTLAYTVAPTVTYVPLLTF